MFFYNHGEPLTAKNVDKELRGATIQSATISENLLVVMLDNGKSAMFWIDLNREDGQMGNQIYERDGERYPMRYLKPEE